MKVLVTLIYSGVSVSEEYADAGILEKDMRFYSRCLFDPRHTLTGITLTVDK